MKKLMIAAAVMAAGVAMAADSIVSSDIVGYQIDDNTVSGFNFVTPTFRPIGWQNGDTVSIQEIQMDATVADGGAVLYRLDDTRKSKVDYQWLSKATCTTKGIAVSDGHNGAWVIRTQSGKVVTYSLPTAEEAFLSPGEGVQVRITTTGKTFNYNGGVSDLQMSVPAVAGFNFVGNPYPADASIQDIQMDATVSDGGAVIYRLDETRKSTVDYQWLSKATCTTKGIAVADGYNGAWVIRTQSGKVVSYSLPTGDDAVLRAGEVLQVRVTTAGKTIYVNPTYEL